MCEPTAIKRFDDFDMEDLVEMDCPWTYESEVLLQEENNLETKYFWPSVKVQKPVSLEPGWAQRSHTPFPPSSSLSIL